MKPIASSRLRAAFTLMEMMLVLFIIALILGGGVYLMQNVGQDAEVSKAASDIKTWETNLVRYKTKAMMLPTQQQGLAAMVTQPTVEPLPKRWSALAKPEALSDPWGRPYQYRNPGKRDPAGYDLYSLGPDGVEGTPDDVGNWQ
ncbi:type II secretion system major pseudopilin GspG [Verrucomicrobium spinosum]|uniref:type II secretion system major pseudopilin GspG n=1 Tax=Verrucomicrobium spinosum TaxID=2736 RepID=UPI000174466F|nr:type II secretion system major pseudopilin GspG [Verrucomicrobium spinosum]